MINRQIIQLCKVPQKFMPAVMAGIDGEVSSFENKTARHYMALGAAFANRRGLVEKLINNGASKDRAVQGAAMGNNQGLVARLIEQGASKDMALIGAKSVGNEELELKLTGKRKSLQVLAELSLDSSSSPLKRNR